MRIASLRNIDKDTLVFEETSDVRVLAVGDMLYWRLVLPSLAGQETAMLPGAYVTAIDRGFAPTHVDVLVRHFINAETVHGDIEANSDEITSCSAIGNFRVGDWIALKEDSSEALLRVRAIAGSALKVNRKLRGSARRVAVYNTLLIGGLSCRSPHALCISTCCAAWLRCWC